MMCLELRKNKPPQKTFQVHGLILTFYKDPPKPKPTKKARLQKLNFSQICKYQRSQRWFVNFRETTLFVKLSNISFWKCDTKEVANFCDCVTATLEIVLLMLQKCKTLFQIETEMIKNHSQWSFLLCVQPSPHPSMLEYVGISLVRCLTCSFDGRDNPHLLR